MLLKDILQRSAHPIIAARDESDWRTVLEFFHGGSSSVARLAWRVAAL
jgi:hypothetical protein